MRVTLFTNAPAPYRLSFYESWTQLDDLLVVYDQISSDRLWQLDLNNRRFNYECLHSPSFSLRRQQHDLKFEEKRSLYFSTGVWSILRRTKPQVVVSAEFGLRTLMAALYCRANGLPLIVASEGTHHTDRLIGYSRRWLRKWICRAATHFWSNGTESSALLKSYGVVNERITTHMTGVDTHFFVAQARERLSQREIVRIRLGLSGTVFLVLGSLSGRKGTPQLRLAIDELCRQRPHIKLSLLFLGTGDEELATREWASNLPTGVVVVFAGFVQMNEIPDYLAASDWGLMPTLEDCWPLATLEMLLAGLPQLFSRYNGATPELFQEGATGLVVDPLDIKAFARTISQALESTAARLDITIVDQFASHYSPDSQAQRASTSLRLVA